MRGGHSSIKNLSNELYKAMDAGWGFFRIWPGSFINTAGMGVCTSTYSVECFALHFLFLNILSS